ncbi:glycosyltransferase [Rhizobium oryzicola]|uniref:Glycosyltransferase n=1 Tax=Rhizobium oryzicola TaxID=1232668 RepID=A0ABT8SS80_9HYPH|nr:glycosyltransferase [Rhizobium oryzicola]MDO1581105.1 glycosyltransferase [Rhizobium oryzicola]
MKVLHFFKTYWPDTFGGVERTIHAICTGVASQGIRSDVLSLSEKPQENSRLFDGHMAYKAKLDFEFASTGFSRSVFGRFRTLQAEADIIHYHYPWPLMDVVHFSAPRKKPTIVTYHSDIVKQKTLLRLYEPLMHRFLGSVDHIVATSPNYIASSPVLQRYRGKVSSIPLGLSEKSYPPVDEALKAKWRKQLPERFFLFVGVFRYYKGIHFLLDAAEKTGLPVVLIGDGDPSYRQDAERRGLKNVHFLGSLPDEDKLAILDLSLGLAFPSHLRSEAFGLSLVEAAMRGKPMISCEIGTGTSFVNQHEVTGLVIPPADVPALAQAMQRLWNEPELAVPLGTAARQRYLDLFQAEQMADRYADLYRKLIAKQ